MNIEEEFVKLTLNSKLYNKDAIYLVAYQLMEDAYIYLDGNPDFEIIVNITLKEKSLINNNSLTKIAQRFLNHLINYTFFKNNSEKKALLRSLILKKPFESIGLE